MKHAVRIAVRLSEVRERLNELSGMDDLTEEHRAEIDQLTGEYKDLEARGRAAAIAQEAEIMNPPPEDPDKSELVDRASVGDVFAAAVEQRATDGATRELQVELGLMPDSIPLELLEERTSGVTPAPGTVGANQRPIIPSVWPQAAASFVGIPQPRVPVGEAVYTVLTTSATAGTPAEGADQAHSTAGFTATTLSPTRIQASLFFSREDRARLAGMSEALRENLNMALSDKLDTEILAGTNGLFTGTVLANNNVTAVTDFAAYLSGLAYGRVDGTYATTTRDLRALVGAGTYAHMGSVYRNASVDRNVLDRLNEIMAGVRVSAHVPTVASNKQNAVVRRGSRMDMVAPIWQGVQLIVDPYTQAKAGEIVITAVMLYAVKLLRAAGFHKQQTQHA